MFYQNIVEIEPEKMTRNKPLTIDDKPKTTNPNLPGAINLLNEVKKIF